MNKNVKRPMVDIRDLWARALDERVAHVDAEITRRMDAHAESKKAQGDASKAR